MGVGWSLVSGNVDGTDAIVDVTDVVGLDVATRSRTVKCSKSALLACNGATVTRGECVGGTELAIPVAEAEMYEWTEKKGMCTGPNVKMLGQTSVKTVEECKKLCQANSGFLHGMCDGFTLKNDDHCEFHAHVCQHVTDAIDPQPGGMCTLFPGFETTNHPRVNEQEQFCAGLPCDHCRWDCPPNALIEAAVENSNGDFWLNAHEDCMNACKDDADCQFAQACHEDDVPWGRVICYLMPGFAAQGFDFNEGRVVNSLFTSKVWPRPNPGQTYTAMGSWSATDVNKLFEFIKGAAPSQRFVKEIAAQTKCHYMTHRQELSDLRTIALAKCEPDSDCVAFSASYVSDGGVDRSGHRGGAARHANRLPPRPASSRSPEPSTVRKATRTPPPSTLWRTSGSSACYISDRYCGCLRTGACGNP